MINRVATAVTCCLAFIGACALTWGAVAVVVTPPPYQTHDWIVFERGADGKIIEGAINGNVLGIGGRGPHCWMLSARESATVTESEWIDPTGELITLPITASRVRVLDGRWEETAASIGIDLQRCQ